MERPGVPRQDWHPSKGGCDSYLQAPTMPMAAVKNNLLALTPERLKGLAERTYSTEEAANDVGLIIAPPHPVAPPQQEVPLDDPPQRLRLF